MQPSCVVRSWCRGRREDNDDARQPHSPCARRSLDTSLQRGSMPYKDPAVRKAYDKAYGKQWCKDNPERHASTRRKHYHVNKIRAIKRLGGECSYCHIKYDGTNAAIFQGHHRNPAEKLFEIGYALGKNWSWSRIEEELDKCDLICANCHLLHHLGRW